MKLIFCFIFFLSPFLIFAQQNQQIIKVIEGFFDAMESKDTIALDSLMHDNSVIFSTLYKKDKPRVEALRKASFLGFMKRAIDKKYIYDEQLWSYDVNLEDNLAVVWTEYTLFTGKVPQVSHCGVNVFTLVRTEEMKWIISNISDTRRYDHCIQSATPEQNSDVIHKLMNNWHQAAANANQEVFFGSMTADAVYLGTDASERWNREELRDWSKTFFERDTAWAFVPTKREVYFSNNQRVAWFEEYLNTWMGPCRASGVLVKMEGDWKIKHYDLSVMIPNDLVKDFIALVKMGGFKKKRKNKH